MKKKERNLEEEITREGEIEIMEEREREMERDPFPFLFFLYFSKLISLI